MKYPIPVELKRHARHFADDFIHGTIALFLLLAVICLILHALGVLHGPQEPQGVSNLLGQQIYRASSNQVFFMG